MESDPNFNRLPNADFFLEVLRKAVPHAKRHQKVLAILLIEIDQIKILQQELSESDLVQIQSEISHRFTTTLRSEDVAAQLEPDTFAILLNDLVKPKFGSTVARKLIQAFDEDLKIGNKSIRLRLQIGISLFPKDGLGFEDLMDKAKLALKQANPNNFHYASLECDTEAREYIQLEAALRTAISHDQLCLHYQPKILINKGEIVGVEALIRWMHPHLGLLYPSQFIPLAEETGLIIAIGEWTLREAIRTSKFWQNEGYEHMTIAINLSRKEFSNPHLVKMIQETLTESQLDPHYLELEITETAVMQDPKAALNILDELHQTGVRISLDHFGTGFTSISHLKIFPLSSIKIDHTFIQGIPNIPNDIAIARAIIALAHELGLSVVAEGVEKAEQVQALQKMNCDMIQGYFMSHPLPKEEIMLQFKKLVDSVF